MGEIFEVYKKKPRESYELGKPELGYKPGTEPHNLRWQIIKHSIASSRLLIDRNPAFLNSHLTEGTRLFNPGRTALWSIMGTPNYSSFRMTQWSVEELADKLYRGCQAVQTREASIILARDLQAWAGNAECVLMPDDHDDDDFKKIGFPTRYKQTRSVYEILE